MTSELGNIFSLQVSINSKIKSLVDFTTTEQLRPRSGVKQSRLNAESEGFYRTVVVRLFSFFGFVDAVITLQKTLGGVSCFAWGCGEYNPVMAGYRT